MHSTRRRLNNVIGQLLGAGRMIDAGQDCQQVLIQLKAANSALERLTALYLQENIQSCFKKPTPQNQKQVNQLINHLVSI